MGGWGRGEGTSETPFHNTRFRDACMDGSSLQNMPYISSLLGLQTISASVRSVSVCVLRLLQCSLNAIQHCVNRVYFLSVFFFFIFTTTHSVGLRVLS